MFDMTLIRRLKRSRSFILVPIDFSYTTFYRLSIVTFAQWCKSYSYYLTLTVSPICPSQFDRHDVSNGVISNDLMWPVRGSNPSFRVTVVFKNQISQNSAFYVVKLLIIHLLNLQCNMPLMHGPSAIAEPCVKRVFKGKTLYSAWSGQFTWQLIINSNKHVTKLLGRTANLLNFTCSHTDLKYTMSGKNAPENVQ